MGTNCAPFVVDLFFYCNERGFSSDLHKSKHDDIMFNDISWDLDDLFTNDNPEFLKYIPNIYQADSWNKEISFLNLKIKVFGDNIHTNVDEKRTDFRFLTVIVNRVLSRHFTWFFAIPFSGTDKLRFKFVIYMFYT